MDDDRTVSQWVSGLKKGDQEAARQLWHRYFARLAGLARQRMSAEQRRVADEEDVALSVFRCLCSGAERGQFTELTDRDDLWSLLVSMTRRKIIDQHRRRNSEKRGGGSVGGESVLGTQTDTGGLADGIGQLAGNEPTPEFLAEFEEEFERMLSILPDETFRQVVTLRLEGSTNEEIAGVMNLSCRSVERKLRKVREVWSQEFPCE